MSPGFPICMILPTCRTWLLGFHILAKYDHHDWEGLGSPESSNSWHWQYWAIFGDNCSLFGDKLLKKVTGLCSLDWSTRKCSQPRLTMTHMWPISQMAAKCQSVQPTYCCHPWLWKALWGFFDEGIYRQYIRTGCTRSEDNILKVFNTSLYLYHSVFNQDAGQIGISKNVSCYTLC